MKSAQPSLFDKKTKMRFTRLAHGGKLAIGKRKLDRPLSSKDWIHLVMKSDKAIGGMSFLNPKHLGYVEGTIKEKARKFGVKIAQMVNVGNHFHLKVKISSRISFQKFLKSVTSLIARRVTGARKGKPFGKFWNGLAFTRVLKSYTEIKSLNKYFFTNEVEAEHGRDAREWAYSDYESLDWVGGSG